MAGIDNQASSRASDFVRMAVPPRERPIILAADDDEPARRILSAALVRRFGTDYDVRVAASADAAFSELTRMVDETRDIALVIAAQGMAPEIGTAFLARTRTLVPQARRMVLLPVGDFSAVEAIAQASTLGEVDYQAFRPSGGVDERFLATVGDILAEWAEESGRYDSSLMIVTAETGPESADLLDTLHGWGFSPRVVDASSSDGLAWINEHRLAGRLPVAVLPDGQILAHATATQVAEAFGWNGEPMAALLDVVVVGAGPAGLSTAVNAASEGLAVLLVEPSTGQASASPMLRNYVGFPAGISGTELIRRGWLQALWFGVHMQVGRRVTAIDREAGRFVVVLDSGLRVRSKVVVVATGLTHRPIGIASVDAFVGRGVFYGAGATIASTMAGEAVAVVGGANSAAEAAVNLARFARTVTVLVRGNSISDSMSAYLVQQLASLPNVEIRLNSEVVEAEGPAQLASLLIGNRVDGTRSRIPVAGLFILIGYAPDTQWLPSDIVRDQRGFVLTGDDLASSFGEDRRRLPMQTSVAGVFAVGDVRADSIKRIASAVGEGASATHQIHEYLASGAASSRIRPGV